MAERILDVVRQPDGRFLASFEDGQPTVEVSSWEDVRRLRGQRHLIDRWSGEDRAAFITQYGHPFDDWWEHLSPTCAAALMADPSGAVPSKYLEEIKRTLRHQTRQMGLGLDGSLLTDETQAFVAEKARLSAIDQSSAEQGRTAG